MGVILSAVLITAPIAFMLGWLVSKALFRHMSVTRPNAAMPSQPIPTEMPAPARAPSVEQPQADKARIDGLRQEMRTLKEAVAEGEHRIVELKEQLRQATGAPDARVRQLQQKLAVAQKSATFSKAHIRRWRDRVRPLARQFKQQRLIISELRDELRARAEEAERLAAQRAATVSTPAVVRTPPAVKIVPQTPTHWDDLQQIRGIGPALQKKLHAEGVFMYQQLAEMPREELHALGRKLGLSEKVIRKNDWREQARALSGCTTTAPSAATASA